MRFVPAAMVTSLFLAVAAAAGQGVQTGTLRGVVRDTQGLVVRSVAITVTSPALQGPMTTSSGEEGAFVFLSLPPGTYQASYQLDGFKTLNQTTVVPLGGTVEVTAVLEPGRIEERVDVVARVSPLMSAAGDVQVKHDEVHALPLRRHPSSVAQLSPGVSGLAPNPDQVVIHGGLGYDNAFLIDGVDVGDNLFGYPQRLFIEDAVAETQVLTSGIPAEYGRFTGGVVNQITRSGGNLHSGSLRLNLANPAWTVETPREKTQQIERPSELTESWEGTLGGPLLQDRLWFFVAGRLEALSVAGSLPVSNLAYVQDNTDRRGEVKMTGTVAPGHTIDASYLGSHFEQAGAPSTPDSIDRSTLTDLVDDTWYSVGRYRGAIDDRTLIEGQFATRRYRARAGGSLTEPMHSPFITPTGERFNAPWFDATDPTERNSHQLTGNATRVFSAGGQHELKAGYEWFRSQTRGAELPSATSHVFLSPYAFDQGAPALTPDGALIPEFIPGGTLRAHALGTRGAVMDVDTSSAYVQDRWRAGSKLSIEAGLRVERARSIAHPAERLGVQSTTLVPRLAASYDPIGNGSDVIRATYGWYSGRYIKTQAGANNEVTNPATAVYVYLGPPGAGRDFQPGFDLDNYALVAGEFPTANVSLDPDLRAPVTRELTLSYGRSFDRGYLETTYVHRRTVDLIEDFRDIGNGVTDVEFAGMPLGELTNVVYRNTDLADRRYDALALQGRLRPASRLSVATSYTVQFRNDGNYEGEGPNAAGVGSLIGDYPQVLSSRAFPDGRLPSFQRHRLLAWGIFTPSVRRIGELSVTGLWRLESGTTYSLVSALQQLTDIQQARLEGADYPDGPPQQLLYFGDRGSETFPGYGAVDAAVQYAIPVFRSLRPYVKVDVFNVLNNQKAIAFNTTVVPDFDGPLDSLGLPTTYLETADFGEPDDNRHYPAPLPGLTGGRTVRIAVGLRF